MERGVEVRFIARESDCYELEKKCEENGLTLAEALRAFVRTAADGGLPDGVLETARKAGERGKADGTRIDESGCSRKVKNCLARTGVVTVESLSEMTYMDLMAIRGLGSGSIMEIEKRLKELGFR